MNKYYVTTTEVEFFVSEDQKKLILALPFDGDIKNRFPFDDITRNKIEVFKIGTEDMCQCYIDKMNPKIKYLFKIEKFY